MTHIDSKGYLRDLDGRLVHRKIAFQKFMANRSRFRLPFCMYQVHHIDGNKANNDLSNLELLTQEEHAQRHQVGLGAPSPISNYITPPRITEYRPPARRARVYSPRRTGAFTYRLAAGRSSLRSRERWYR